MKVSEQFPHVFRFDLFADLPRDFVRDFADRSTIRHFQDESVILREGQIPDAVYILLHGTLDITVTETEGRRLLLHRGGQGTMVGDVEILAEIPCIATCETGAAATLLSFPKALLYESLDVPLFCRNLARVQAMRLERANQLRSLDNSIPIERRVATFLCYLADRNQVVSANQNFLADLVGCSRQTVNRELRALRDHGVIETHNSWIRVLDRPQLESIAQSLLR